MTRAALAQLDGAHGDNVGLVLDRYLPDLRRLADASAPAVYRGAYARWASYLEGLPGMAMRQFAVGGRLSVGLGAESVQEWAVTLHRMYGVPIIPGSALKGLARHYAAGDDQWRVLFGDFVSAAYLTHYDAWYIPGSAPGDAPLVLDVVNVHHPYYYAGQDPAWPSDFDDPRLVPFLSARGAYLVAVRSPRTEWAESALRLLEAALSDWGIGARTSSGYGRLHALPEDIE